MELRRRGMSFPQIARAMNISTAGAYRLCELQLIDQKQRTRCGGRFEVIVRPALIPSLAAMFEAQGGHGPDCLSLAEFVGEIVESAIVDFRALKVERDFTPAAVLRMPSPKRQLKVNDQKRAHILELRRSEKLSSAELAARFSVSQTTVKRVLREASNG